MGIFRIIENNHLLVKSPQSFAWRQFCNLALVIISAFLASSCADTARILPVRQRIVILRTNTKLYQYPNRAWVRFVQQGDTLLSFATCIEADESGNRRVFLTRFNEETASVDSDNGKSVATEYELLTQHCDTEFILPSTMDSIAWVRALRFVEENATDAVERSTATLIQTGKRLRAATPLGFIIRRKAENDGTRYTIRANDRLDDPNARRCAFFMQTGKTEREFYEIDTITHSHHVR